MNSLNQIGQLSGNSTSINLLNNHDQTHLFNSKIENVRALEQSNYSLNTISLLNTQRVKKPLPGSTQCTLEKTVSTKSIKNSEGNMVVERTADYVLRTSKGFQSDINFKLPEWVSNFKNNRLQTLHYAVWYEVDDVAHPTLWETKAFYETRTVYKDIGPSRRNWKIKLIDALTGKKYQEKIDLVALPDAALVTANATCSIKINGKLKIMNATQITKYTSK